MLNFFFFFPYIYTPFYVHQALFREALLHGRAFSFCFCHGLEQ